MRRGSPVPLPTLLYEMRQLSLDVALFHEITIPDAIQKQACSLVTMDFKAAIELCYLERNFHETWWNFSL